MKKIKVPSSMEKVSNLMQAISLQPRLEILLAIGDGETCVCHLESVLGYRQAYISQNLMALREAGVLSTRRDGKYIFYRSEKPETMEMVELAARMAGVDVSVITARANQSSASCDCPKCSPQLATRATAQA